MTSAQNLSRIVRCVIHPAVGIARVGNSQSDHFIGPEAPGWRPGPDQRFKDQDGRVKRQVARFRVYGLDSDDRVVAELTADDATIAWRVHLANRKAGWYQFQNAMDLGPLAKPADRRNAAYDGDRADLVIDPGPRRIAGRDVRGPTHRFDTGRFCNKPVYLGELRTDADGRLLVFGGHGHAASATGAQADTFANNDGWHDDVADGPVYATVTIGDRTIEAEPALVAVTPPNFGPGLYGVVTMYDVVADLFADHDHPPSTSFWRDIHPILERLATSGASNAGIWMLFGPGSPSDLQNPATLAQLADPAPAARRLRERIFRWFRDPAATDERLDALPPFYGDAFGDYTDVPGTGLPVTRSQYAHLQAWAAGTFDPDPAARETWRELADIPLADRPHALDRASLESCLGGPFHPGIELTWTMRHPGMWARPFRLRVLAEGSPVRMDYGPTLTPEVALGADGPLTASGPGTLTWWMGVPWQTDEASCMSGYQPGTYLPTPSFWAARVPNEVLPEAGYLRMLDVSLPLIQRVKHLSTRGEWLRFFSAQYKSRINSNIALWDRVGIICERPGPADAAKTGLPERVWVETEVWPGFVDADPTLAMVLIAEGVLPPTGQPTPVLAAVAAPAPPGTAVLRDRARPSQPRAHARPTRRRDER